MSKSSSLSSVVSNLVRASMGSAVSSTVTDEDLDRHVAELILKEAKQKAESYSKLGFKAYLPNNPDPNAPRPNKRFLSSIIRSTDDHNKTILRAQALAAQEIKREREEQERKERRARAEEAVAAERMRRLMGGGRKSDWDSHRDPGRGREKERDHKKRARSWERRHEDEGEEEYQKEGKERRSRRHRSRSPERRNDRHSRDHKRPTSRERPRHKRHSSRDRHGSYKERRRSSRSSSPRTTTQIPNKDKDDTVKSYKRPRSVSLSDSENRSSKHPRQSSNRATRSPSRTSDTPHPEVVAMEVESHRLLKGKYKAQDDNLDQSPPISRSPSPTHRKRPPSPSTSSSRTARSVSPHVSSLPSKMDKYFEESYDPRLDVAPLTVPTVPATGLISDAEFAGWDAMLELLRQRREDKEEKKRMERLGIGKDKSSSKAKKKADDLPSASDRWTSGGDSIMDIEYKKRGSVREWDLGKEGF
ncbi:hypothetical protein BJ138DRAFT_1076870 [Hygrophoropsis aurantiaca]|uniref:Uncharacterized protein n=1 Tax=Hygrophoropsis aurantiaca TaxID=72124 RepID=A0ACB8AR27_9AGAM|nr:hypothetical protein BJ138DRAFT_1076870 [Hygrophoropsis aurantiaca]